MDEAPRLPTLPRDASERNAADACRMYVGRWNRLVSTTNWEKGRIISEWREALIASGAPHADYADDAWSRCVEGVSGQHAGRLRRVFQRFGHVHGQYEGLFWSHFQAALDWGDAEMWLEGAAQNHWSVAQMRRVRWETLGAVADQEPREEDLVTAMDEDFELRVAGPPVDTELPGAADQETASSGTAEEGADPVAAAASRSDTPAPVLVENDESTAAELVRPFANLADLPADLAEAFEGFKLAILRHKTEGWLQTSPADVLNSLDALKELVTAPSRGPGGG